VRGGSVWAGGWGELVLVFFFFKFRDIGCALPGTVGRGLLDRVIDGARRDYSFKKASNDGAFCDHKQTRRRLRRPCRYPPSDRLALRTSPTATRAA